MQIQSQSTWLLRSSSFRMLQVLSYETLESRPIESPESINLSILFFFGGCKTNGTYCTNWLWGFVFNQINWRMNKIIRQRILLSSSTLWSDTNLYQSKKLKSFTKKIAATSFFLVSRGSGASGASNFDFALWRGGSRFWRWDKPQSRMHFRNRASEEMEIFQWSWSSWWFQPIWKILVKLDDFPK